MIGKLLNIYIYMYEHIFPSRYINKLNHNKPFDPCPLKATFDGLKLDWADENYINPPYNQKGKEAFIMKAFHESQKGKLCVMLIPANTDTKIFHNIIVPNAEVLLIKGRIKFKGYNIKGEYVTNCSGQTGSMFVIFGRNNGSIRTVNLN